MVLKFSVVSLWLLFCVFVLVGSASGSEVTRPNIVFLLADDLGIEIGGE